MNFIGYILLGVVLFFLITYYGDKYNFTKSQNIIFSLTYLLIVSGIFMRLGLFKFNEDIFMIIVAEVFCQIIYIGYVLGKDFFNKEDKFLLFYASKIIITFLINQELINKVNDVFLSGNELKTVTWILIAVYFYNFFKNKDISIKKTREFNLNRENIVMSFTKLKLEYGEDIILSEDNKKLVLYAIMIFNNYSRPLLFRKIDNLLFILNNKPQKLGIMQIMSKKYINDYESIISACKKIDKLYKKDISDTGVINSYDKDNCKDICNIYEELKKFCKL